MTNKRQPISDEWLEWPRQATPLPGEPGYDENEREKERERAQDDAWGQRWLNRATIRWRIILICAALALAVLPLPRLLVTIALAFCIIGVIKLVCFHFWPSLSMAARHAAYLWVLRARAFWFRRRALR